MTFAFARHVGVFAAATAILASAAPAGAAVTLRITGNNDAAFENVGGSLQAYYDLANPTVGASVLPPLERAVGEIRGGSGGSPVRRALHLPTAATGTPVSDGGTGVFAALTNAPAFGSSTTNWVSGAPVAFAMARVGNVVSYTIGANVFTSNARASMLDINAFEFRIRSNTTSVANPANSILMSNLVFNDSITVNQALADFSAADGAVNIALWDGVVGDFSITGNYTMSWTGTRPNNSALASQLKLLAVPMTVEAIPEPASWAMLIAGFGLTGATLRRRRSLAA